MRNAAAIRDPQDGPDTQSRMSEARAALATALERSPLPLYLQVAEVLRKRLESGLWRVGDRLPSIETLADEMQVARMTLRQALDCLEAEGALACRQGRGTFVTRDLSPQRRYRVATDWASLVSGIAEGDQQSLPSTQFPDAPRLDSDQLRHAKSYRFMKRLNLKDGVAYGFMSYHIASHVFEMNAEGFLKGPVLPTLAKLRNLRIDRAWQTMAISTADAEAANILRVPLGSPVVLARRFVVDESHVAIFVSDITYRGDHVRFEVDLLPGSPFEKQRASTNARESEVAPAIDRRARKARGRA